MGRARRDGEKQRGVRQQPGDVLPEQADSSDGQQRRPADRARYKTGSLDLSPAAPGPA